MKNISSFDEFKMIKEAREFTNNTKWSESLVGRGLASLFKGVKASIRAIMGRNLNGLASKIDKEYLKGVILWCIINKVDIKTGEITSSPVRSTDNQETVDNNTEDTPNQQQDASDISTDDSDLNDMSNIADAYIPDLKKSYSELNNDGSKHLMKNLLSKLSKIKNKTDLNAALVADKSKSDDDFSAIKLVEDYNGKIHNMQNEITSIKGEIIKLNKLKKEQLNNPVDSKKKGAALIPKIDYDSKISKLELQKSHLEDELWVFVYRQDKINNLINNIKENISNEYDNMVVESTLSVGSIFNKTWSLSNMLSQLPMVNVNNNINKQLLKEELPETVKNTLIDDVNLLLIAKAMSKVGETAKENATNLVDVNLVYEKQLSAEMLYTDSDGRTVKDDELKWKKKIMLLRSKYKDVLVVDKVDPTSNNFILSEDKRKQVEKNFSEKKNSTVENSIKVEKYIDTLGLDPIPVTSKSINEKDTYIITLDWDGKSVKEPQETTTMAIKYHNLGDGVTAMSVVETYSADFVKNFNIKTSPDYKNNQDINFLKFIYGKNFISGKVTKKTADMGEKIAYLVFNNNMQFPVGGKSDELRKDIYFFSIANNELYVSELPNSIKDIGESVYIDKHMAKSEKLDSNRLFARIYSVYRIEEANKEKVVKLNPVRSDKIKTFSTSIKELFNKLKK